MFMTLLTKEIMDFLRSPKFPGILFVTSILIIGSVAVGIREYRVSRDEFEAGKSLAGEMMKERGSWARQLNRAYREPDPLQIFVSGVSLDIGRWTAVGAPYVPHLQHSTFSENNLLAVFRYLDLATIILVALSLVALVLTHDAICGEKEAGTLRLVFSHDVSRAKFFAAKCAGCWIGLMVPLSIPILISILLVELSGTVTQGDDWLRILMFLGISGLYLTFCIVFGVMLSTFTQRSATSFLVGLATWVFLVFIYPRAAVAIADRAEPVSSLTSVEAQRTAYSKNLFAEHDAGLNERIRNYLQKWPASDTTIRQKVQAAEQSLLSDIQVSTQVYERRLVEGQRHARSSQQELALNLCRVSPAAVYQIGVMALARTDVGVKLRFEEAVDRYRADFVSYVDRKWETQSGPTSQELRFRTRDGAVVSMTVPSINSDLNLSDMPVFVQPRRSTAMLIRGPVIDAGILSLSILLAFIAAMWAFRRYDLR